MTERGDQLGELAALIRSKNAGPFLITFDIMFRDRATYERVVAAGILSPDWFAATYLVPADTVQVYRYSPALSIKVTIPRRYASGDPWDGDVFGCQQYGPLVVLPVPFAKITA
jgi:hypothetical protein